MNSKDLARFHFSLLIVPIIFGTLSFIDHNNIGVFINIFVFAFLLFKGFSNLSSARRQSKLDQKDNR